MFDIHYSVLHFNLEIQNDCTLYENKISALRGILGQALAVRNCFYDVKNRDCKTCVINKKCLGNCILSANITGDLYFQSDKVVSPIVIRCKNTKRNFEAFDTLSFTLIILGDTSAYIPQIIDAYSYAGTFLGLGDGFFNIRYIKNEFGDVLFDGGRIYKDNLCISKVSDYINARKRFSGNIEGIKFLSPLSYKADRKLQRDLTGENFKKLLERRILTLNALEGKSFDTFALEAFDLKTIEHRWFEVERFSNRQKRNMNLNGILGSFEISTLTSAQLDCLIAGELLHIGKSTSFGLGEYEII